MALDIGNPTSVFSTVFSNWDTTRPAICPLYMHQYGRDIAEYSKNWDRF